MPSPKVEPRSAAGLRHPGGPHNAGQRKVGDPASGMDGIRRYRMTVRARLALTYSALLTGAGVVMMALVYVVLRFVPTYDFAASTSEPASPGTMPPETLETAAPVESAGPMVGASPALVTDTATELLISSPEQLFNLLLWVSAAVLVLLAIVGVAVGWLVAGRMLKPLQYINTAVHRAAGGDLGHRISLVGPKDEISELAGNFDGMLEQLERSFAASQRFAQNASHELRTPLATTRAMLDVALVAPESPEQQKVLERLRIMNERSIETVSALLELASIEASQAEPQAVDLAGVAREVLAACAPEAAGRGISPAVELKPAKIVGDPVLLRQLLVNLVQNAIRHNRDGGSLTVVTGSDDAGAATIQVSNSGSVLDAGSVAELLEPFRRGAGRTSYGPGPRGHGLGLAIVQAVVERHHGTLDLAAPADGGLRVTVQLPAG